MEAEGWKRALEKLLPKGKAVNLLVLLGLGGVLLIFLSSVFEGSPSGGEPPGEEESSFSAEEYEARLEQRLVRLVCAVTGEKEPTVLVTLENGGSTVYAEDRRRKSSDGSSELEDDHVLLRSSDGAQQALPVSRQEPEIRGVVIVSARGGEAVIRERLVAAVRTALGLSSARVCIVETQ